MGDFKEWLSDNLRYFLVGVVVILIIGGSILGLKIYSSAVNGKDEPALIQKNTQAQTETKKETEKETKKQTEKETKKQTEKETKKQTKKSTEKSTEKATESQASTSGQTYTGDSSDGSSSYDDGTAQNGQNSDNTYSGSSNSYDYSYDDSQQAEVITPETEAPQPQYMTINAACYMRSYPDYGDNIIGQFDAGTTVQFLADEGGWYKVSVNGQTGYIGARFFN